MAKRSAAHLFMMKKKKCVFAQPVRHFMVNLIQKLVYPNTYRHGDTINKLVMTSSNL